MKYVVALALAFAALCISPASANERGNALARLRARERAVQRFRNEVFILENRNVDADVVFIDGRFVRVRNFSPFVGNRVVFIDGIPVVVDDTVDVRVNFFPLFGR